MCYLQDGGRIFTRHGEQCVLPLNKEHILSGAITVALSQLGSGNPRNGIELTEMFSEHQEVFPFLSRAPMSTYCSELLHSRGVELSFG